MTAPILTIPSTRPDPAPSGIETGDPELREGLRLEHAGRLLGVFPIPAALLLLPPLERGTPDEARGREALPRLLAGDAGGELPGAWAFLEPVSRGDLAAASALLTAGRSETEPRDPVLRYSRLVLSGRAEDLERWNAEGGPPAELGPLVDALAFVHGWIDQAPSPGAGLPPEAAAAVQMVRAAWHLEQGAAAAAQEDLAQALGRVRERSPLFAAQLAAQRAELLRETDPPASLADLRLAVELSEGTALPGLRADLFLALGLTLHAMADGRRGPLLEAVRAYQEALQQGITADTRRDDFALVQSHLGLAYLSLPMEEPSARLRQAVAVQSLKKALEIYRPESHPEAWASTQLNLANALQYLPSAHPRENLVQAVELYEALLEVRHKARDPVGHARLLANQANALAHLGIFAPALGKLEEARKLFSWHGEEDLARGVLEQVAAIHEQRQKVQRQETQHPGSGATAEHPSGDGPASEISGAEDGKPESSPKET